MDVKKTHKKIHFLNKLAFKNVFFKYPLHEREVLNNVTFEIKKGEVIGVAGSSGSGKTTIADLILGLINPTKGVIQIDDQILGNENLLSWQEMLSYVPQNTFILEGSIKENITFGSNDETEESKDLLNDAIDKAGLREFIESLPKGVETEVGEKGYMISGGQKQRIGIARAFYNKSKFIIFDEATNAQDNITEAEILKSIFDHKDKFTFLIIAHRLSTLENCDNILFLKNGEISDSGNFNQLKETSKSSKQCLKQRNSEYSYCTFMVSKDKENTNWGYGQINGSFFLEQAHELNKIVNTQIVYIKVHSLRKMKLKNLINFFSISWGLENGIRTFRLNTFNFLPKVLLLNAITSI